MLFPNDTALQHSIGRPFDETDDQTVSRSGKPPRTAAQAATPFPAYLQPTSRQTAPAARLEEAAPLRAHISCQQETRSRDEKSQSNPQGFSPCLLYGNSAPLANRLGIQTTRPRQPIGQRRRAPGRPAETPGTEAAAGSKPQSPRRLPPRMISTSCAEPRDAFRPALVSWTAPRAEPTAAPAALQALTRAGPTPFTRCDSSAKLANGALARSATIRSAILGPTPFSVCSSVGVAVLISSAHEGAAASSKVPSSKTRRRKTGTVASMGRGPANESAGASWADSTRGPTR